MYNHFFQRNTQPLYIHLIQPFFFWWRGGGNYWVYKDCSLKSPILSLGAFHTLRLQRATWDKEPEAGVMTDTTSPSEAISDLHQKKKKKHQNNLPTPVQSLHSFYHKQITCNRKTPITWEAGRSMQARQVQGQRASRRLETDYATKPRPRLQEKIAT